MGSGGSDYTSYGNGGGFGGYDNDCKGPVSFIVLVDDERTEDVWDECNVNDSVQIIFNVLDGLPVLEVVKTDNSFSIGLVPAKFGSIIRCIHNGWTFAGNIIKKSGSKFNSQITVELWGAI